MKHKPNLICPHCDGVRPHILMYEIANFSNPSEIEMKTEYVCEFCKKKFWRITKGKIEIKKDR